MVKFQNFLIVLFVAVISIGLISSFTLMIGVTQQSVLPAGSVVYRQQFDTPDLSIGDLSFVGSAPSYTCSFSGEVASTGNTPDECWQTSISFDRKSFSVEKGETVRLNPFLDVTYETSAEIQFVAGRTFFEDDDDWSNTFTFKFTGVDFIFLSGSDGLTRRVLNQVTSDSVVVRNDFTNFDGGFRVVHTTEKLFSEQKEIIGLRLSEGTNVYNIPIPSGRLGNVKSEIHTFILFADQQVFVGEPIILNNEFLIGCENNVCGAGQRCIVVDNGKACEITDPRLVSIPGGAPSPAPAEGILSRATTLDRSNPLLTLGLIIGVFALVILLALGAAWLQKRK